MGRESTLDRWGNEIYLTDERWEHIVETHEEMTGCRDHIFTTIRTGKRRQDAFDSSKYKYTRGFNNLPMGFSHVVVVVKFSRRITPEGVDIPNNFILTAYQVSRR